MKREIQHPPPESSDRTFRIQGPEVAEQKLGAIQRRGVGWLDPTEGFQIPHPGGLEGENRLSQIEALDFREFPQGPPLVVPLGPKPHADTRRGATRTTGALGRGGGADFFDEERVDAPVGIMTGDAGQPGIDDERDAIDRQRGFGDIGRNDDLASAPAIHGLVLLGSGKLAMQRKNRAAATKPRLQFPNRALDFVTARHEHQDIPLGIFKMARHGVGGRFPDRIFAGFVAEMEDFHGMDTPLGF